MEVGEYGTDLCVHRDDIADEFPNEDLRVVRVYVDEDRNLRRIDSDTYLRSIVEDGPDNPMLFMDKLFEDAPPDATPDDAMPSTILRETIPPEFVRLDDPDGETVVTNVMDLDTDRSKHDLLFSLATIARQENYSPEILQSIEETVEKLNHIEEVEGFDDWLKDRLL